MQNLRPLVTGRTKPTMGSTYRSALLNASMAVGILAATGQAQSRVHTLSVDVQKLGPQVGTSVPDFSLPDQSGRLRTLGSLMGSRGVILVFFRSADW